MAVQKASPIRTLKPGEILFNDGDTANSLYIIQKGQIRLYKPKGKGFIEIAVLRSGEVIGEMAYFDDDGSGGKRSCAASALFPTDIIEIPFTAFAKKMESLNPWFKTIINTLATRLRKTNARVKELETNSGSSGYGKQVGYEFIKLFEVCKVLGTLFLVFKSHADADKTGYKLHRKVLDLYAFEIYTIQEAKLATVVEILKELNLVTLSPDADGNEDMVMTLKSLEAIRTLFIFFNTERHKKEEAKVKFPPQSLKLMEGIANKNSFDPRIKTGTVINLQEVFDYFAERNIKVDLDDLGPAQKLGICGEAILNESTGLELEVMGAQFLKMRPIILFKSMIDKLNEEKNTTSY